MARMATHPKTGSSRPVRRSLRALMRTRLPGRLSELVTEAGRLGRNLNLPVYAVGGFVRDLLLGIRNFDLDLVVEGRAPEDAIAFARALAKQQRGQVKVHERFGTAVVILPDRLKVDVAMARTESYAHPAALPRVRPSSIEEDLRRRDFTINQLAIRLDGRAAGDLLDCHGGERNLLHDRVIRVLHDRSFIDDPTRIFRAVRFEQRFGFRMDRTTLALLKDAARKNLPDELSGHRLLDELVLLLSEREPRLALRRAEALDLLRFVHPDVQWTAALEKLLLAIEKSLDWHRKTCAGPSNGQAALLWLPYVMALLENVSDQAVGEALTRLTMPARPAGMIRQARRVAPRVLDLLAASLAPNAAEAYRALLGLSDETLLFLMAKAKTPSVRRAIASFMTTQRQVKPVLTGTDLKRMGIVPGPQYRGILNGLLEARLNGQVRTRREELALARRLAKS